MGTAGSGKRRGERQRLTWAGISSEVVKVALGEPDFHELEPTDELVAPSRAPPACGLVRVPDTQPNSAFRHTYPYFMNASSERNLTAASRVQLPNSRANQRVMRNRLIVPSPIDGS
jgi:hypothetical protein